MDERFRQQLITLARERISNDDPSHDFAHAFRVLVNAEHIAHHEGGDLDTIVPAALFHDVVNRQKDHPRAAQSSDDSADYVTALLATLPEYPMANIPRVASAIRTCSFTKAIPPETREGEIVHDADMLESTGAIAIMRLFASTGQMHRPFCHAEDPFCRDARALNGRAYALDVFSTRLLKIPDRLHTATARRMAEHRHAFLRTFLDQLARELRDEP